VTIDGILIIPDSITNILDIEYILVNRHSRKPSLMHNYRKRPLFFPSTFNFVH